MGRLLGRLWMAPPSLCQGAGAAGYGKVVSHVVIGLKTVKGVKQLKLDPTIYDSLMKEKVQVCSGQGRRERRGSE